MLKTTSVEMLFFGGGHLELHRYLVELCNSFGHNSVPQCPDAVPPCPSAGQAGCWYHANPKAESSWLPVSPPAESAFQNH